MKNVKSDAKTKQQDCIEFTNSASKYNTISAIFRVHLSNIFTRRQKNE